MYRAIAILAQLVEQGISNAQVVGSSPIDGINRLEVNFKIMATRKKSDSGSYMSAYDNEVEAKIQGLVGDIVKLQAEIATLKEHQHEPAAPAPAGVVAGDPTSERVEKMIQQCRKQFPGSPAWNTI